MAPSSDDALIARLAPKMQALHEAHGGDWAATLGKTLTLLRQEHLVGPDDASPEDETPDAPREDD